MDQRFSAPGCLGHVRAGWLALAVSVAWPSAQAFTLTSTPSEAPAVQSQVVGQAALEDALNEGEGASLQLSDALSIHPRPTTPPSALTPWLVKGLKAWLWLTLAVWGLLTVRQWLLTMNRVSDRSRQPYQGLVEAAWPKVSVVVLAHNSQALVGDALQALMASDYPAGQLQVVVVNDRSTDRTRQIMDEQAQRHGGRIVAVHRTDGRQGRAACLLSAMPHVDGDFLIVLGAEDRVGPAFLKQIMAPFFDPEVGSVVGRVMPWNVQDNWLTRLADLDLSAQQQVVQQARANLGLQPEPGGLVAWRRSALVSAFAASSDAMADAVDVAQRLSLRGWLQVHQAQLQAHRVQPQTWAAWRDQLQRSSLSQHRAAAAHLGAMLVSRRLSWAQKIDGLLTHLAVCMPLLWVGAALAMALLHLLGSTAWVQAGLAMAALAASGAMCSMAPHFQLAAAARLDGRVQAIRLMPLQFALALSAWLVQAGVSTSLMAQAVRRLRGLAPGPAEHAEPPQRRAMARPWARPPNAAGSSAPAGSFPTVERSEAA